MGGSMCQECGKGAVRGQTVMGFQHPSVLLVSTFAPLAAPLEPSVPPTPRVKEASIEPYSSIASEIIGEPYVPTPVALAGIGNVEANGDFVGCWCCVVLAANHHILTFCCPCFPL